MVLPQFVAPSTHTSTHIQHTRLISQERKRKTEVRFHTEYRAAELRRAVVRRLEYHIRREIARIEPARLHQRNRRIKVRLLGRLFFTGNRPQSTRVV